MYEDKKRTAGEDSSARKHLARTLAKLILATLVDDSKFPKTIQIPDYQTRNEEKSIE
jgi:hypothetical protein